MHILLDIDFSSTTLLVHTVKAHPGTIGKVEFRQSLRIWCKSVWQMPQYAIWILMSSSPSGRRVNRNGARWPACDASALTYRMRSFTDSRVNTPLVFTGANHSITAKPCMSGEESTAARTALPHVSIAKHAVSLSCCPQAYMSGPCMTHQRRLAQRRRLRCPPQGMRWCCSC